MSVVSNCLEFIGNFVEAFVKKTVLKSYFYYNIVLKMSARAKMLLICNASLAKYKDLVTNFPFNWPDIEDIRNANEVYVSSQTVQPETWQRRPSIIASFPLTRFIRIVLSKDQKKKKSTKL